MKKDFLSTTEQNNTGFDLKEDTSNLVSSGAANTSAINKEIGTGQQYSIHEFQLNTDHVSADDGLFISAVSQADNDMSMQVSEYQALMGGQICGPICLSRLTGTGPITKHITLDANGGIAKRSTGHRLYEGEAELVKVNSADEFADLLESLENNQALAFGVTDLSKARLMTQESWTKSGRPADALPRDREHFHWPNGPGILMLDFDPPKEGGALSQDELLSQVYSLYPALKDFKHIWRPSAGSCIYNGETGEELIGIRGQRIYIFVTSAYAIPRIGRALYIKSWLAGHGSIQISKAGSLLERGLFDTSVWQPERLDYAGGAVCDPPLEQRRPAPMSLGQSAWLRPDDIPEITIEEEAAYLELVSAEKNRRRPEADVAKAKYIDSRATEFAGRNGIGIEEAKVILRQAVSGYHLSGDFQLLSVDGLWVTVSELLDNQDRYHGARFADPLEPDYHDDHRVAYANLHSVRPFIYSHAHGGQRYLLQRQPSLITLAPGDLPGTTDRCLALIRSTFSLYEYGGRPCYLAENRFYGANEMNVQDILGKLARFEKYDGRSKANVNADCPDKVAKMILARNGMRNLPQVNAIITAPTMRLDGTILDRPGFDKATGLLYIEDELQNSQIPANPTEVQAKDALALLMEPFADFPFCDPEDWGVFLSALFTSALRPVLPTAPAFAFDAPSAGSGKTLLAKCLSVFSSGREPPINCHIDNEDEMRKQILTALIENRGSFILDNIVGKLDSKALTSFLTSETYNDRILGKSSSFEGVSRVLFLATGNNLRIVGDLNRRVLVCRIDPKIETPYKRQFNVNPLDFVKIRRLDMVCAALTLLRFIMKASNNTPSASGRMASFENWDDLVRQSVCWIAQNWLEWNMADPMGALDKGYEDDPETQKLRVLLLAWRDMFHDEHVSISDAIQRIKLVYVNFPGVHLGESAFDPKHLALQEAFEGVTGDVGRKPCKNRLGRWIERQNGRIIDGMRFDKIKDSNKKINTWSVQLE